MNLEKLIWAVILIIATLGVALNTMMRETGRSYVRDVHMEFVNVSTDKIPSRNVIVASECSGADPSRSATRRFHIANPNITKAVTAR